MSTTAIILAWGIWGGSIGKAYSVKIRRGEMNEQEWRTNAYTLVANGCSGFEYSTLTPFPGRTVTITRSARASRPSCDRSSARRPNGQQVDLKPGEGLGKAAAR